MSRVPPHNLEAEQSVLASMLIDSEAVTVAAEILKSEDFYREAHGAIFAAMGAVADRREPVDLITVSDELRGRGELDKIGGLTYLAKLSNLLPSAATVQYYANIVREKARRRAVIRATAEIARMAYDGEVETRDLLAKAEESIFAVSREVAAGKIRRLGDILDKRWTELYNTRGQKGVIGVKTGFKDLDLALGGLQRSDLIILAARPSMGKTAFEMQMGQNVARSGGKVLKFSLEMAADQLADRVVCAEAEIDSQAIKARALSEELWDKGALAAADWFGRDFFVDDESSITTTDIRAKARRVKAMHGLDLVMIDYLGLIGDRPSRNVSTNDHVGSMVNRLKAMAKELQIPVVLLCQLSREVTRRADKRPTLADLRDSGEIEQTADVVIFLHRPEYYDPQDQPGVAEVIIAKHRNGPTGTIRLQFDKQYARFRNLAQLPESRPVRQVYPPRRDRRVSPDDD